LKIVNWTPTITQYDHALTIILNRVKHPNNDMQQCSTINEEAFCLLKLIAAVSFDEVISNRVSSEAAAPMARRDCVEEPKNIP